MDHTASCLEEGRPFVFFFWDKFSPKITLSRTYTHIQVLRALGVALVMVVCGADGLFFTFPQRAQKDDKSSARSWGPEARRGWPHRKRQPRMQRGTG